METMATLSLAELLTLILGGGGLVGLIVGIATIKYERMKARGEARTAEDEATKKVQEIYQTMVADQKQQNEEHKQYIEELKRDRRHLREEKDTLQKQVDELRRAQREQAEKIAQLGRMVKAMAPLICGNTHCKMRERDVIGLVSDDSFTTDADTAGNGEEEKEDPEPKPQPQPRKPRGTRTPKKKE